MNNEDKLKQCVNTFSATYYQVVKGIFPDVSDAAVDFVSDEADKIIEQELQLFQCAEDIEMLYQVLVKDNPEGLTKDFLKKFNTVADNMEKGLQEVLEGNEDYLEKLLDEGEVH